MLHGGVSRHLDRDDATGQATLDGVSVADTVGRSVA
jgi:hypothetical protein